MRKMRKDDPMKVHRERMAFAVEMAERVGGADIEELQKRCLEYVAEMKEDIALAFAAKYGLRPDEMVMVQDGPRWYVKRVERPAIVVPGRKTTIKVTDCNGNEVYREDFAGLLVCTNGNKAEIADKIEDGKKYLCICLEPIEHSSSVDAWEQAGPR